MISASQTRRRLFANLSKRYRELDRLYWTWVHENAVLFGEAQRAQDARPYMLQEFTNGALSAYRAALPDYVRGMASYRRQRAAAHVEETAETRASFDAAARAPGLPLAPVVLAPPANERGADEYVALVAAKKV
jgi:hypothetical protein